MTKIIYLAVDVGLNWIFIRTVKRRLVNYGIVKYDKLVTFNIRIIAISLAMDVSTTIPCTNSSQIVLLIRGSHNA
jgi:hypothetical protein